MSVRAKSFVIEVYSFVVKNTSLLIATNLFHILHRKIAYYEY